MKPSADGSPLQTPMAATGLSDQLIRQSIVNGYNTIADFLDLPLTKLVKLDWLTPAMMEELINYLRSTNVYHTNTDRKKDGV
jgi:hypothetical protein